MDVLAEQKEWFYLYEKDAWGYPSSSVNYINYFLNDPFYKNAVSIFQIGYRNNLVYFLSEFRAKEKEIISHIAKDIDNEHELPADFFPRNLKDITQTQLQSYTGSYVYEDLDDPVNVRIKDDHLIINSEFHYYYIDKDTFKEYKYNSHVEFKRDSINAVVGVTHNRNFEGFNYYFYKID